MVERFGADGSNMNQEARIYPVRLMFADRSRVRLQDLGAPKSADSRPLHSHPHVPITPAGSPVTPVRNLDGAGPLFAVPFRLTRVLNSHGGDEN